MVQFKNMIILMYEATGTSLKRPRESKQLLRKNAKPSALLLCFCTSDLDDLKCGLISVSNILKRAPVDAKARLIDVILFLCVVFSALFN